ncbi:hypothetical protein TWF506_000557 [Arthrobotrys conoides]|uniref:Uncharacterized protein n=1 Tax=Arthrobotrys conoides TaxID=74498 RepID=A0AAN8NR68_9PEZI
MFAPSYNLHVDPSTCQGRYDPSDETTRLAGWRYGSMTPPEAPTRWYNLIIPESTKRIILGSTNRIEEVEEIQPNGGDEPKKEEQDEEEEEAPTWRYGLMTPPKRWYDRFVPKSIKRRQVSKKPEANEPEEEKAETETEEEIERKKFLKREYGDVDYGHCAASGEWAERGACMCTITWSLPGRFPRSFCETICNGVAVRTGMEVPPVVLSNVETPEKKEPTPEPCWEVKPDPLEPETRLCWVKQYNPRLQRYEYVAKPWRLGPGEGKEDEAHEYSHGILEPEYIAGSSTPRRARGEVRSPFSCGRKPPWLQHVHRFVRAEELDSPPPPASQFVSKTGTLLGKFSEGYLRVPYYDPEYRKFRYAEPRTIDMNNLKLEFNSTAPPPKPVAPRRPRILPKRPLVMAQKREPVKIRMPKYDTGPRYESPPVRVPVRPKPTPTPKPRPVNPYHSPRFVVFSPSSRNPQDDTPCPPPRKPKPKYQVTIEDDDGEYQPDWGEESEEREVESPSVPKKTGRRRRRRNSDPTYKQHGVREDNKTEKNDLQQMKNDEEVAGNSDGQSKEKPSVPYPVKPKPGFKPKPILKNSKEKDAELTANKNEWYKVEEVSSQASNPKKQTWEPQQNDSPQVYPKTPARKEKASQDGEYIQIQDREEERQERIDILDMKNQVDKGAGEGPGSGSGSDNEQSGNGGGPSRPVKTQKKTGRRRKAPEDRAYQPGRRVEP